MKEEKGNIVMNGEIWLEVYGYLGSFLVVVSMLMASVVKLRIINGIGSVISGSYALIIGSFPLALMNICLIIINCYNLFKLLKTDRQFDLVDGAENDSFLTYFLERHEADIRTYFPDFDGAGAGHDRAYLVCCNGDPAGVLLGRMGEEGVLDVQIDYSVPAYRDCSVGKYLYARLGEKGVDSLRFCGGQSEAHTAYLTKMGFEGSGGTYRKKLN